MARVSRRNRDAVIAPDKIAGIDYFRTALYERLSVEDNGKADSESLENQDRLLRDFIKERPFLDLKDVYVDNGHSGTTFDRPEFMRLMDDVRSGEIDCIIVKDFSRLGRNYVEAGNYIEKIFPFFGVRFISVNDNYDSISVSATDSLNLSLKNVINDMYAKDISKKLCSTMKEKRLRGEYIGNYAPYGYLKDPENHSRLIIDPETAPIVIEIFELRSNGCSYTGICRLLNEKGYPSPGRLRFERGIITNNNKKGKELLWNIHVLKDLLANVVYIGNLAQGRSTQCLYKGISFHWTESTEWDIVENTHEPIISLELWNMVQEINSATTKSAKASHGKYSHLQKRDNPYHSLLRCADCGRVMKFVRSYSKPRKDGVIKDYYHYKCPLNIELGDSACSKKNIKADDLDLAVFETIKTQMSIFLDIKRTLDNLIAIEKKKAKVENIDARIKELEQSIIRKRKLISSLYADFRMNVLSEYEYNSAREKYQIDVDKLDEELKELSEIQKRIKIADYGERRWKKMIDRYYNADSLSPELITALIDEITIDTNNEISVKFKYMNEFEEMMNVCEQIKSEVA